MKKSKMITLWIQNMFSEVIHYGVCTWDEEGEKGGHYYRKRHFKLNGFLYEVCQRDGELIIFKFLQVPED